MTNPFKAALDSKLGRKLRGISIVDNENNPASALNMQRRRMRNSNRKRSDTPYGGGGSSRGYGEE